MDGPGFTVITHERVHARARWLAQRAGRGPLQVCQADYEQARREVTGESDPDLQDAVLDAGPAGLIADRPGAFGLARAG